MSAPDPDQKTEDPTPKRRQKAARDGDVPKSRELLVAAVMLAGCAYLAVAGTLMFAGLADMLTAGLSLTPAETRAFTPGARSIGLLSELWLPMSGLFAICCVAAVAGQAALGGLRFSPRAARPRPSKLNPFSGLKRMFGPNALIELGKSLLKVLLTGSIGIAFLLFWVDRIAALGSLTLGGAFAMAGETLALLLLVLCGGLAIVAAVDVPSQHHQRMKKLRMTKQEVKDEQKQAEGAPELKAARRNRQREIAKGGARAGVAEAQMVLANPTHFAVALRYDPARDAAPVVTAAGKGEVALAIKELAAELDRPLLSYPDLTRAIYFTSSVGKPVRSDLFTAVATVLAFVLDVDRRMAGSKPQVMIPPAARFDANGKIPRRA
ncbi:MAG: flagellar type III secretion system protein FlhB [Pseudomonadota bacterium]